MSLITTLSTLKTAVTDTLNRGDLSVASGGNVEIWIQLAEQRFQRDPRVREPGSNNVVLPSLMTTDPNWLLTAHPDIYLYGTLVESAPYLRDEERLPVWEQRYQDAVATLAGSVRLDPNRTALAVATYANLQTLVADALNRGDIKNVVPVMISLAEAKLATDDRVRIMASETFSITQDDVTAPAGLRIMESWYHDGGSYSGPIEIVNADGLGALKARYGPTGVPRWAAILNGAFRFAPAPDTTYSTKMVYWRTITALSAGVNGFYTNYPHIYLRATLAEAGPWVRGDAAAEATVAEAQARLQEDLDLVNRKSWNDQWGGGTLRRQFSPIG